jgi:hypothetical protein
MLERWCDDGSLDGSCRRFMLTYYQSCSILVLGRCSNADDILAMLLACDDMSCNSKAKPEHNHNKNTQLHLQSLVMLKSVEKSRMQHLLYPYIRILHRRFIS